MTDRRHFLATSTALGFGATMPGFVGRTARAAAPTGKAGSNDKVLVVIQLTGGNDGLNTVIPFKDAEYARCRPTIAVPAKDVVKLTDSLGLHPALAGIAGPALSVVQAVGYPNPSQSHFRSMDVWHAASLAETLPDGWLGRAMKAKALPGFHLAASGTEAAPLALTGAPAKVPSVTTLADFQLKTAAGDAAAQKKLISDVAAGGQAGGMLDFVRRTAADTYASSDRLQSLGKGYDAKATYPATALATRLKLAAQLIDAGVGARVFYVSLDGFDTHAGQGGAAGVHAKLLGELGGAMAAFMKDVAAHGHADRVAVMTFSEFGRRARENGSFGTDHGSAAPMLLACKKRKAAVVGEHPSLTKLDDGNLVHAVDFRRVYAGVLKDWLGVDPAAVVPGFAPVELFQA